MADDPGQGTALYEAIASQDTTQLSADEWADRLEALERVKARLAAWEAEAVAGFEESLHGVSADLGHRHPEPGDRAATPVERRWVAGDLRSVADELALIFNMGKGHATSRIRTSCELVRNFPATLHALREGELTERAAFTIVSELSVLDDIDDIRAAEAAVLQWARTHPLTDIKQECRRAAAHQSPAASDKRHQRAHDERSVQMFPDGDGRATLVHDHDAIDAAAVMTSLSRSAARHRHNGDARTMDQLRSDIAMSRLLRRTQRRTSAPVVPDEPATTRHEPSDTTGRDRADHRPVVNTDGLPADGATSRDTTEPGTSKPAGQTVGADEQIDIFTDDDPFDDQPRDDLGPDPDVLDEATIGAEAMVVIHATGAEVAALLNGEVATGGEADHHGPIPQNSLRKHLINALTNTLLPNLPTTTNSPRPGATIRPRTNPSTHTNNDTDTHDGNHSATPTGSHTTSPTGSARSRDARVELRITDLPPPSDPDRYTPSAALDRYVRLRDRRCQFPGCNRPAEFTDLDHRIPFAADGRTTADNLWCLCRHHHRLKHEGGWQVSPNPDGSWTWTSPTGRRYRNNPTTIDPPPKPTTQ
jgi:hypothetical protein